MLERGEWHQDMYPDNARLSRGCTQDYLGALKAFLPNELRQILEKAGLRVLRCGGLGSLCSLCEPDTIRQAQADDILFERFLDLCERFDREILPDGPGTQQRAGLLAVAERPFRTTRYQGAIVQNDRILLIKHRKHDDGREYWVIPGGGREANESEEECVRREMKEETHLDVRVERLLLDEPAHSGVYTRRKTYLCTPLAGRARPGYEPEPDAAQAYAIVDVVWFDLRDETTWDPLAVRDQITYPQLQRIRAVLGYGTDANLQA
jgi:ADP-ribose pyrophosphatase YjhB (NUDIX family)